MLVTDLLKEPQVWALMRQAFPGIDDDVGDMGAGLIHLEFAALRRRLETAADNGNQEHAIEILAFVDDLLGRRIHPDVENAVDVSFIEDLYLGEKRWKEFVVPLLPSRIRGRWNETVAAHEGRRSG